MNRKYLPQRELELSVNQDLYPNFCNLNISFGSKVMAKFKFFFQKKDQGQGQIFSANSNVCHEK